MSEERIFTPRVLAGWLGAAVLTFVASLYLGAREDAAPADAEAVQPSSFSRAATGHAGFAALLERRGIMVVRSRSDTVAKLGAQSLLVIAEPRLAAQPPGTFPLMLRAPAVLVVLPKWRARASAEHDGWIAEAEPASTSEARRILDYLVGGGEVVRRGAPDAAGDSPEPAPWTVNRLGPTPQLDRPAQLLRASRLTPIVAGPDGILLGEIPSAGRHLWVLADPDVIENHGLGRGGNAAFAVALVGALRGAGGNVVIDETLHGYTSRAASPLRLLVTFPFVLVTAQGALAFALLLWVAGARFGAAEPAAAPRRAGTLQLVETSAELLEHAGHQRSVLRRFAAAVLRDAGRRLHAPRGLDETALAAWLGRIARSRGVARDGGALYGRACALALERRPDPAALITVVRDLHDWKRELTDGPSHGPTRGS